MQNFPTAALRVWRICTSAAESSAATTGAEAFANCRNCMPWHGEKRGKSGTSGESAAKSGSGAGGVNLCAEVLYLRDKINQPKAFNHR